MRLFAIGATYLPTSISSLHGLGPLFRAGSKDKAQEAMNILFIWKNNLMVDHRLLLRFESGAGHIEKVTIDASEHTENYLYKAHAGEPSLQEKYS